MPLMISRQIPMLTAQVIDNVLIRNSAPVPSMAVS